MTLVLYSANQHYLLRSSLYVFNISALYASPSSNRKTISPDIQKVFLSNVRDINNRVEGERRKQKCNNFDLLPYFNKKLINLK